jgi:hypothetical protein
MNWDAIGAVGELVGASAVLVTLVYLAVQIRQNSKMMRANSKQSITDATQHLLFKMLDEPELSHKFINGGEFDSIEHTKAWLLARAMFRGYEAQIYQHEVGLLDDTEWEELRKIILQTASLPGTQLLWPELSDAVSPSLRRVIDESREKPNVGVGDA